MAQAEIEWRRWYVLGMKHENSPKINEQATSWNNKFDLFMFPIQKCHLEVTQYNSAVSRGWKQVSAHPKIIKSFAFDKSNTDYVLVSPYAFICIHPLGIGGLS